jgi:hypothetical protein
MPPGGSSYDLRTTIAERWRAEVMGSRAEPRSHWKTRVAYYRAVCEALATAQGRPFTWRGVVAAVRPSGSSSTFYEVAGRHAKHALIDVYHRATDADALQIAFNYRRDTAIERLIDEAKVWSFWEYRETYLRRQYLVAQPPADALVEAVADWATKDRTLAAALHFAPPVCAVEDLVALHHGGLAALRAQRWLSDVVREAVCRPRERCGGALQHGMAERTMPEFADQLGR